jgi:thiol-disulfide isomerase/thioredoxin
MPKEEPHMAESRPANQPPRVRGLKSYVILALVVVVVLVLVELSTRRLPPLLEDVTPGPEARKGIGRQLTFLQLKPLTGDPPPLSLSDLQGHVTLLNFWGTWCPPCRTELPHMAELRRRFAGQTAFRLVAISYPPFGQPGDLQLLGDKTASLLKQLNLDLPTYCDPDSKTLEALAPIIDFSAFPTTVLLDRHGAIRAVWVGYGPGVEADIEGQVDVLLNEIDGR